MKIVMVLGIIIGFLLCSLVYIINKYTNGNMSSTHLQVVEKNSLDIIKTYCHNNVEYIIINGNGTSVTLLVDQDGKPLKCTY
ncbi:MAG: hypothetical protein QG673_599 [Pseudomonadota bacterium]|nr:hypothetical protein [Pseudomonadota bacterium]